MTTSLINFILSLLAGSFIVAVIGGALIIISNSDRVSRNE